MRRGGCEGEKGRGDRANGMQLQKELFPKHSLKLGMSLSLSPQSGSRLQVLRGHTAAVKCVLSLPRSSSEEDIIMTGSLDKSLRVLG